MNKGTLIGLIILIIIIVGGYFIYKNSNSSTPNPATNGGTSAPLETTNPNAALPLMATTTPAVKEFTVSGKNYSFTPNTLTVKKGDHVKITFVDTQGMHNFKIDEFNALSKTLKGGSQDVVEFTADKTGQFQYYCAVGQHRAMGMWGTLTVTE